MNNIKRLVALLFLFVVMTMVFACDSQSPSTHQQANDSEAPVLTTAEVATKESVDDEGSQAAIDGAGNVGKDAAVEVGEVAEVTSEEGEGVVGDDSQ